ncbi:MAG: hypothetical protein GY729_01170, partial [Desulfobacteraceae bacterium]|nr:hypothetical protein [Desulfobacteraceae bacterium]
LKYYGVDFLKQTIRNHIKYSKIFYDFIENDLGFEILAPKPLSTVCFRALPKNDADIDEFNQQLMDKINETGKFFISHTKLDDKLTLRHVVSGLRTKERHVRAFIELLSQIKNKLEA